MKTRRTGQDITLEKLSDKELLRRLDILNQKERETTLSVLLHLNEVERRRLYLTEGYNSLFDYCTRRLRYSESSANRRIRTARCIRDYPEVFGMISGGELNLCTVSRIAGILTVDNRKSLLREVRGKSMRDVEMIVSRHRPERMVRDRVRPVYIMKPVTDPEAPGKSGASEAVAGGQKFTANVGGKKLTTPGDGAHNGLPRVKLDQKFKLEFMVDPRFMQKVGVARALLSNRYPRGLEFEKLFEILLDEYLDRNSSEGRIRRRAKRESKKIDRPHQKKKEKAQKAHSIKKNHRVGNDRSRHISQSVRDEVFSRDGGRCTFVSKDGVRCVAIWNLQIDHIVPYSKGGDNSADNLRLLCAKHNRHEAERVYGKEFMKQFYQRE